MEPHVGRFQGPRNCHLSIIKFESQITVPNGPALFYLSCKKVLLYYWFFVIWGPEYCQFNWSNKYVAAIPSSFLREMLRLIQQENSLIPVHWKKHETALGTKMAVGFTNIYMAAIETQILSQSSTKSL